MTVRYRRADYYLPLLRVAIEQHVKGRQQRHEQRHSLLLAQRFELLTQMRWQVDCLLRAAIREDGRARVVSRQFEDGRRARQVFSPIRGVLFEERALRR